MPNIYRIAIKDIFLELLYNVKDTESTIDAKSLCNVMRTFSYDFIKGIMWELHSDGMVDLKHENEYNYIVNINDRGIELKENGGYAKNYRNLEFEIAEAKSKAVKRISTDTDIDKESINHPAIRKRNFSLSTIPILRPLFKFRKYQIAGLLLKIAVHQHATAIYIVDDNLVEHKTYQKHYMPYPISNFFEGNPKLMPERVLEAVDILAEANHIIKNDNKDVYKITIEAKPEGERAYNDGYYLEQTTKTIWKTFGAVIGGGVVLFSAIKWLLPPLLRLLM